MKRHRLYPSLRAFCQNEQGAVAMLFGLMVVVFVLLTAVAIDVGNAYRIRTAIQDSLDSAMLAAGTDPKEDEEYLKGEVRRFLDKNLAEALGEDTVTITVFNFTFDNEKNRMKAFLRARSGTLFFGVVQQATMLHIIESAVQRPPPMEIAIVIDESPRMLFHIPGTGFVISQLNAQKRIAADLVSLFMRYNDTKIGVVPYANLVNTAKFVTFDHIRIKNPTWATLPAAWTGCVGYRLGANAAKIDSSRTDKYPGYLVPDSPLIDPSPIGPGDPANLTKVPYCGTSIYTLTDKSRQNGLTNRINSITGFPPWLPVPPAGSSPMPISWDDNNGNPAIGLIWGWNMLTSEPPLDQARTKEFMRNVGGKKVIVLISYSSDGYEYGPARDGQTGAKPNWVKDGAQLTREICQNIKDDDIIIYAVQFANSGSMDEAFQECASDEDHYFKQSDMMRGPAGGSLRPEYISREIARQLLSPRLIKW